MYVPAMENFTSNELGHRNYQHPRRRAEHFGPYIDNFSAWVIYASIVGLSLDHNLWEQLGAGDDCLLFRQSDFLSPETSSAFLTFEHHKQAELRHMARLMRSALRGSLEEVQHLQLPIPTVANLSELPGDVSFTRSGPRIVCTSLPNWLREGNGDALAGSNAAVEAVKQKARPSVPWITPSLSHSFMPALGGRRLEPELQQALPRRVVYDANSDKVSPSALQFIMLFNPAVWLFVFMFFKLIGPDAELMRGGQDIAATLTNVTAHGKSVRNYEVEFAVRSENGQVYTDSQSGIDESHASELVGRKHIYIHALPNKPLVREPLFSHPGTLFANDLPLALFFLVVNIFCEIFIWWPAQRHKKLARNGHATLGKVSGKLVREPGRDGNFRPIGTCVVVDFLTQGMQKASAIVDVDLKEYDRLEIDDVVTVLYNADFPRDALLYQCCRYKAVSHATHGKRKVKP
jgi:hypothetical protein